MTALAVILAVVAALAVLAPWALRHAFKPHRAPGPTPEQLGLAARDVSIPTERGRNLAAWFLPPAVEPGPAVAVVHGWGSSAAELLPLAAPLRDRGIGVLLLDARCHGRSDDDDFASMPRFAEDLSHALDWLKTQPAVDAARLGAIGHSVGGAAAILTASRRQDLACVVAVSAFAHPRQTMQRWLAAMGIPRPVIGWWILRHVEKTIGHSYDAIAPVNVVQSVTCPLLVAHGRDDHDVPAEDAWAILAARGDARAEILLVDGFGHGSPQKVALLLPGLMDFLGRTL